MKDLEDDGFKFEKKTKYYTVNSDNISSIAMYFRQYKDRYNATITSSSTLIQDIISCTTINNNFIIELEIFRSFNPDNEPHFLKVKLDKFLLPVLQNYFDDKDKFISFLHKEEDIFSNQILIHGSTAVFLRWYINLKLRQIIGSNYRYFKPFLLNDSIELTLKSRSNVFWDITKEYWKKLNHIEIEKFAFKNDINFINEVITPYYFLSARCSVTEAINVKLFSNLKWRTIRKSIFNNNSLNIIINENFRKPIKLNQFNQLFVFRENNKTYVTFGLSVNLWTLIYTSPAIYKVTQQPITDFIQNIEIKDIINAQQTDKQLNNQFQRFFHISENRFIYKNSKNLYEIDLSLLGKPIHRINTLDRYVPAIELNSLEELHKLAEISQIDEIIFRSDVILDLKKLPEPKLTLSFSKKGEFILANISIAFINTFYPIDNLNGKNLSEPLIELSPSIFIKNSSSFQRQITIYKSLTEFSSDKVHFENEITIPNSGFGVVEYVIRNPEVTTELSKEFGEF